MKLSRLVRENIRFYLRFYKLVALAVAVTVAVITGSLMTGESVRATLVQRVNERLGDTETILFTPHAFFDSSLAGEAIFEGKARAVLVSNGFVSDAGRLIPVTVWGVDGKDIPAGGAKPNPTLAAELSLSGGEDIVLRLPAAGLVPSGSLFVTGHYTTGARLAFKGIAGVAGGGNLNLKNEQTIPCNLFVNRTELASLLETEGKANLLLCGKYLSAAEINGVWSPALSGIQAHRREGFTEIVSSGLFIPEEAVQAIRRIHPEANRLFSYLANSMETAGGSIPYSFVTAMDAYKGRVLREDEVILSDYAAARLKAKPGDTVCLTCYYAPDKLKTLHVDTFRGRVAAIAPLAELTADSTLSARFPGLSEARRCTDWDSDLPIDMSLITREDEDYWALYRATPKAILPYGAVCGRWSNAYGSATAIRTPFPPDMGGLDAGMFGWQVIHPREAALAAARGGVDFSSLFLSLGFFIILSALLLLLVPLAEMMYRRRNEIALLTALGYSGKRIVRLLWSESAPVVLAASLAGVAAGVVYTWLILLLLGSLWKGATQTGGFILFPGVATLAAGWAAGVGLALVAIPLFTSSRFRTSPPSPLRKERGERPYRGRRGIFRLLITVLTLLVVGVNGVFFRSAALFVPAGILLMVTAALWGDYLMVSRGADLRTPFNDTRLVWAGLLANRRRALLSFFTLAAGVFIVFSVGLNRKGFADPSQLLSGTGGYALWCESAVPVYHNLSTPEGRAKLALSDLPAGAEALQIARYGADDASCLNLNKVSLPTVLGVDMQALGNSRFRIRQSIYPEGVNVFEALQTAAGSVYPALVDESVLTWNLMRKLGDTLRYETGGRTVCLQIAGTLDNSVFQGNLLIDKNLFAGIWSETAGSEIILFKAGEQETEATKRLVEQALHEYGVRVTTTGGRLQAFNSVTDTYLTIFLTLGGLGLLLGIAGFIVVVRKDLASRQEQIELFRSLGFDSRKTAKVLIAENRIVPLYAIAAGLAGSLAGISGGFANVSLWVWLLSAGLALVLIFCVILFIHQSVVFRIKIKYS